MGLVHSDAVSYCYPDSLAPTLKGISFFARPHERLSVVGGNLSGKTTLANVIVRSHLHQLAGHLTGRLAITFGSHETSLVGFLFDDPNWSFCNLRVEDEVAFGLENLAVPPNQMRHEIGRALEAVGLAGFEARHVSTLSGGELQKLAIASSLVTRPGVLVTDDLLSNVDIISTRAIIEAIEYYRGHSECAWIDLGRHWPVENVESSNSSHQIAAISEGRISSVGTASTVWAEIGHSLITAAKIHVPEALQIKCHALNILNAHNSPRTNALQLLYATRDLSRFFRCRCSGHEHPRPTLVTGAQPRELRLRNISFGYPETRNVLTNCDIDFTSSAVNILAGRNGSGKSTLAKIIAGLLRPTTGEICRNDVRVGRGTLRERVALVFQNPEYHFLSDTVWDELLLTARLLGVPKGSVNEKAEALIEQLSLAAKRTANPFALTIGEKRRLAIGICIMRGPNVLIVDEPTLGQDLEQSAALGKLFRQLCLEGITPVVLSHDAWFIYRFGDVINVLEAGRVSYSGAIPPLFQSNAKSDFAGAAAVLNTWTTLCKCNGSPSQYPRSVEDLFSQLSVIENGA